MSIRVKLRTKLAEVPNISDDLLEREILASDVDKNLYYKGMDDSLYSYPHLDDSSVTTYSTWSSQTIYDYVNSNLTNNYYDLNDLPTRSILLSPNGMCRFPGAEPGALSFDSDAALWYSEFTFGKMGAWSFIRPSDYNGFIPYVDLSFSGVATNSSWRIIMSQYNHNSAIDTPSPVITLDNTYGVAAADTTDKLSISSIYPFNGGNSWLGYPDIGVTNGNDCLISFKLQLMSDHTAKFYGLKLNYT